MMTPLFRAAVISALIATPAAAQDGSTDTAVGGLAHAGAVANADGFERVDEFTIKTGDSLVARAPEGEGGTINAIVEIPAGTSAKWEIMDDPTVIGWEQLEDGPRVVEYLGYPGNYGIIPGTALPEDLGGDGDPLDVIVLGQAAPRGTELAVRLIGVLKMTDQGARDDKLLAVMTDASPFAGVETLEELDTDFPGVSDIVSTWFTNYKGPNGGMTNEGFGDVEEARAIFNQAVSNYGG